MDIIDRIGRFLNEKKKEEKETDWHKAWILSLPNQDDKEALLKDLEKRRAKGEKDDTDWERAWILSLPNQGDKERLLKRLEKKRGDK